MKAPNFKKRREENDKENGRFWRRQSISIGKVQTKMRLIRKMKKENAT